MAITKRIYKVENSYHLIEGLDSEFFVIAETPEIAKTECLKLLKEDQNSHLATIRANLADLQKSFTKQWAMAEQDPEKAKIIKKVNERNMETVQYYMDLLENFHGYKKECLTVWEVNPRFDHGEIQYMDC